MRLRKILSTILISCFFGNAFADCTQQETEAFESAYSSVQASCLNQNFEQPETGSYCRNVFHGYGGVAGPVSYDPITNSKTYSVHTCYVDCAYLSENGPTFEFHDYSVNLVLPRCVTDKLDKIKLEAWANENPKNKCGSIIQTSNQVVGETIPVIGASFYLSYFSNWVIGRRAQYKISHPLSTDNPNVTNINIKALDSENNVLSNQNYTNMPVVNLNYEWDGKENNVETWGSVIRHFVITRSSSSFSFPSRSPDIAVGGLKAKKLGLGAWLPSVWNFYDKNSKTLYSGSGSLRVVDSVIDGTYIRVASEDGNEIHYFDNVGRIALTKTGLTGTTIRSFNYDSEGRLSSIEEPFNRITIFSRYANGKLKAIIAPHNIKSTVVINSDGYLEKITNPNNEAFNITYDTNGLLLSFNKPNGQTSTMGYDLNGNLISDTHSSNSGNSFLNKINDEVTITSALGRVEKTQFFPELKKEVTTSSSGFVENFINDKNFKNYSSAVNSMNTILSDDPRFSSQVKYSSTVTSTEFGNRTVALSKSADMSDMSNPYSINSLTEVESSGDSEVTSIYTATNKTKLTTSKLGKTSKTVIDEYERPVVMQTGDMVPFDLSYNENNLTVIRRGTRKTVRSYYANDLLKSIRDDLGQTTTFTYDDAQRLLTKTLPDSRVVNYTYDSAGNLTSITPPNARLHQMIYGANEKIATYQPPSFNSGATFTPTNYTYNNDRQLRRIIRPDGQTILHNYNTTTSLLETITGNFGTIAYSYSYERPSNINYNGSELQISYLGKTVNGYNLSNGGYPVYSYNRSPHSSAGQKVGSETITGGNISSISHTINYSYDDDEYVKKAGDLELNYNSPNGQVVSTRLKNIRDYYYYNNFGEVRAYKAKYKSTEIYSYNLERDSLGRITKKTEVLNNVTTVYDYTYDSVGRLIQVNKNGSVSSTYVYDSNSNRIGGNIRGEATVALYNSQDRLYQYNDKVYGHYLTGERAYRSLAVNPQPTSSIHYYWDPFGNLQRIANEEGGLIDYFVDPALRRSVKMTDGVVKQRYAYNPDGKIVGELDDGAKLVKAFVYGVKEHVPDYYLDKNGNKFRIITDNLGSIRMIVAAGSGRVVKIMEHDEFGRVLQDTRPGYLPFGFAGGLYDKDSGLVRFGARDYDSETGSWLSKDPIRFNGGDTNLYGYVLQDPVNWIDPSGKSGMGIAIGIGEILGGTGVLLVGATAGPFGMACSAVAGSTLVIDGGQRLTREIYDSFVNPPPTPLINPQPQSSSGGR